MSQPSSSSSTFRILFDAALQDYKDKTGEILIDHPIAKQLETCESVNSITAILQEQAQSFRAFWENDGKLTKALSSLVDILCAPSIISALNNAIGLVPFPPAKAVIAGFGILLTTVKETRASYDALLDLFASFENFLSRLAIYTGIPPTPSLTNVLVKIIVELISTLALATKQVKQGRFKKFFGKLRGEKDIEATIQRLDRLTLDESRATAAQTLEIVYGLVQRRREIMDDSDGSQSISVISQALETMQEIVTKMNQAERDKLQQDVRKWLSPPDPWKNHNLARGSRHSGTGTWWIESDTYAKWKSSGSSSLVWIHGKPGAGKSIICSAIIEDVRSLQKSGLASLAFFYCDFREDQKKDVHGLLSSLLVQLGAQSDVYSATLSNFYATHGRGSQHASDDELLECLKNILKCPGQATVHIIIDALDECPVTTGLPSSREKVLELVEELVNLHVPNLRICVTSRPEADIVLVLQPLASCSVSLHDESGQVQDITEYVKSVVHTNREMKRWKATDKQLVIDVLIEKSDGMFRWTFCQLAYLRRCIPARIRHALEELPTTLDETYARTLQEIDEQNWEYAHRLFQCVAAASRPLCADELAEFLAFDFKARSTPAFLADWRSEDPEHEVLSICSTLLVAVKRPWGSPVIQFAHFSVKEYLTSARLAETKDTISRFHVSMTPAHTIVAQACLGVLLHLDENITKDSLEDFPLAKYAAEHWVYHAQIEGVSSKLQDGMKRLFDPSKSHLKIWVWLYDPEFDYRSEPDYELPLEALATPLHYAVVCNMHDIATFLIVEHSQDVNARGFGDERTPLHVASGRGHVEIARLLLEHGADIEAWDDSEYVLTPLGQATHGGHVELAQDLLEHGADANSRSEDGFTPLHWASHRGGPEVVQLLLNYGADVTAQSTGKETPLHWATEEEVARLLLEHGADANALDIENRTPLHQVDTSDSWDGCMGIVRVLLEHGADANALDIKNRTPLHHASNLGTAQVLLEHGADANALDIENRTPLHHASNLGPVQRLLDHGVDANAQDKERGTPLYRASNRENPEVVRLLLSYGADVTARCKNNETPLHRADVEEVARLLLQHGADANALDIENRTPLHHTSELGHVGAVRVLLEHGVDVNARDANNLTPLHLASNGEYWYLMCDVVRLLLQYGSDIHALDDEGRTPFMRATAREYHEIMQLLLEHGAEDHRVVMTTDGQARGDVV